MEKGELFCTVGGNIEIPHTLKMDLSFDPAVPLLGIYPKEPKTVIWKNIGTHMFTTVLFIIMKLWK